MATAEETGIALLRRVVASNVAGPDLPAMAAVAERLRAYLAGAADGVTLEQALGILKAPNGAPWYLGEGRELRNRELRVLVARHYPPGGSVRSRALWLRGRIGTYASASWPRDRAAKEMPARYAGTEREYLFRAFAASVPPMGERQLREILSTK